MRQKEEIRRKAAEWVIRNQTSQSDEVRRQFDEWLASDPAHRRAYDQAAESYDLGGLIRNSELGRGRSLEKAFASRRVGLFPVLAFASIAALISVAAVHLVGGQDLNSTPAQNVYLVSGVTMTTVELKDGSLLSLAPASEVRVVLDRETRKATLAKGRLTLRIARNDRPFLVEAGNARRAFQDGSVTAIFASGRGLIEREGDGSPQAAGSRRPQPNAVPETRGPASSMSFDGTSLRDVVRLANQNLDGPVIRLAADTGTEKVTGIFSTGDTRDMAAALAAAFHLSMTETADRGILLAPRR